MTRAEAVEALALGFGCLIEATDDGDDALAIAESVVDDLVRSLDAPDGFSDVAAGLTAAARREPFAVGTIAAQALVELAIRGDRP